MALVWEVEGDVTPQAVIDGFGTDAAELFQRAGELVAFILSQDPDWTPTAPPYKFTSNPDGTVTVGDKIEAPPNE